MALSVAISRVSACHALELSPCCATWMLKAEAAFLKSIEYFNMVGPRPKIQDSYNVFSKKLSVKYISRVAATEQ